MKTIPISTNQKTLQQHGPITYTGVGLEILVPFDSNGPNSPSTATKPIYNPEKKKKKTFLLSNSLVE